MSLPAILSYITASLFAVALGAGTIIVYHILVANEVITGRFNLCRFTNVVPFESGTEDAGRDALSEGVKQAHAGPDLSDSDVSPSAGDIGFTARLFGEKPEELTGAMVDHAVHLRRAFREIKYCERNQTQLFIKNGVDILGVIPNFMPDHLPDYKAFFDDFKTPKETNGSCNKEVNATGHCISCDFSNTGFIDVFASMDCTRLVVWRCPKCGTHNSFTARSHKEKHWHNDISTPYPALSQINENLFDYPFRERTDEFVKYQYRRL